MPIEANGPEPCKHGTPAQRATRREERPIASYGVSAQRYWRDVVLHYCGAPECDLAMGTMPQPDDGRLVFRGRDIPVTVLPPGAVWFKEHVWRVSRQAPVAAGARATSGDPNVLSQQGGLRFHSDTGEVRFLPMGTGDLPSETELPGLPIDRLARLLQQADRVQG